MYFCSGSFGAFLWGFLKRFKREQEVRDTFNEYQLPADVSHTMRQIYSEMQA